MKKEDFLRELDSRLHILNEAERKDIIDEYSQHIDLKIANGLSEEDAAGDFGDIKIYIKCLLILFVYQML